MVSSQPSKYHLKYVDFSEGTPPPPKKGGRFVLRRIYGSASDLASKQS